MNRTKLAAAALFCICLIWPGSAVRAQVPAAAQAPSVKVKAEKFYRTELYFGRSKPRGGVVSEAEWTAFLADTVTPRFPDGFTVLTAIGQYREKSGRIVSEPSQVVIFLYHGRAKMESRAKIEEIRAAYVKKFEQESVLRVDLPKRLSVSF